MSRFKLCLVWVVVLAFSVLASSNAVRPAYTANSSPFQSADELVAKLLAAKSEEARAALLDAHKELLTAQLSEKLANQGKTFTEQGNYPAALVAFQLARAISEQISYTKGVIVALSGTGNVQLARGEVKAALDLFQQALKLAEASGEKALLATLQNGLCLAEQRLGNLDQATEHCQRGLALAEAAGDKLTAARTLNNLGIVARQRGDYAATFEFYRKSLALYETLADKRSVARLLNNLGVAYNAMGNTTAALQHYLRSLPIAEEIGNKAGVASTLNNVSMIYRALGNYKLALEASQRSLAISEAIGDKTVTSYALEEIGRLHAQVGEHAQALECYRKSLALAEQTGVKVEIAMRLQSVGNGYRRLGDHSQAAEYYQRSLALAESIVVPYTAIVCRFMLAQLYLQQGRAAEALELAERAVDQARQIGAHKDYWQALLIAGSAARALKQPAVARQRFEEAISEIEIARAQLAAGEREQAAFFENRFDPYIQMVMLLVEQGRAAEAFSFVERAKARVLLDVLQSGKTGINKALSAAEQEQERRLRGEMTTLNSQLRRTTQTGQPEPARVNELKASLQKARLAYEAFQSQLYAAHPELKVRRGEAQPLKLEEAAALTDANVALLEYIVAEEATYLFALTKAAGQGGVNLQVYPLAVNRKELAGLVETFRQKLAARDFEYRESARRLHDLLLKPAQAQLQGKQHIVIVPDLELWDLPFQALLTGANRHLIEEHAVSYAPSLTVLREMITQRRKRAASGGAASLLALGNPTLGKETVERATLAFRDEKLDPLPEAEREAKTLAALYGAAQSKVFVGADAREDRAKAEAGKFKVLHFATHGILNDAAPLYSHLVLAQGDANEDGLLEAWELLNLDLQADLAVLSACETARGRVGAGEGMIGLSWALFVAGVPTTVVSQWKTGSASTAQLMIEFHRQLKPALASQKTELTRAGAMRAAALKLLAAKETRHPFYWAGFVVVGDGY
jgi:CHAT domain-containing protein/tetratricopeptide (TPR) repeat protein